MHNAKKKMCKENIITIIRNFQNFLQHFIHFEYFYIFAKLQVIWKLGAEVYDNMEFEI